MRATPVPGGATTATNGGFGRLLLSAVDAGDELRRIEPTQTWLTNEPSFFTLLPLEAPQRLLWLLALRAVLLPCRPLSA